MRLKIASRSSDLARIQAFQVARALKMAAPDIQVEFEFRASLGDQNLDVPLSGMQSKGVFTQDFFEDLKQGRFDLVVHSWKDLPTENREGTRIAATLARADLRDLMLVSGPVWRTALQTKTLTLLSSSPRRSYNLRDFAAYLPGNIKKIEFKNVRGNVPTRIDKMFSEESGLILAKAALDRLLTAPESEFETLQAKLREQIQRCRFMVLPVSLNPSAAAQGAFAIEVSEGRSDLSALLDRINDEATYTSVTEERNILTSYGGGCHQKIGVSVLRKPYGVWTNLRGLTESGEELNRNDLTATEPFPKAASIDCLFPLKAADNSWFTRESIATPLPSGAVWIARADAWPENPEAAQPAVVWTSGLESWKKLAARGLWVNGCAEGLGDEDPRLAEIAGRLEWTKLTHSDAPEVKNMQTLATYRLQPKDPSDSPDLKGKTHFFWMSGTSFRRARDLFPQEIENGFHSCGPGQTYEYLKAQPLRRPPAAFLNLEAFLRAARPS